MTSKNSSTRRVTSAKNKNIATVMFLAGKLEKPVLAEGPAGVGKTELAKALAPPCAS